jgi:hypothetical protein
MTRTWWALLGLVGAALGAALLIERNGGARTGLALGFSGELPGVGHLGGPAVLVGPLLLLAGVLGYLVRVLIGLGELPVLINRLSGPAPRTW